jgi:Zn finger protein HypA/HybF involved in hydrogenase expression
MTMNTENIENTEECPECEHPLYDAEDLFCYQCDSQDYQSEPSAALGNGHYPI